MPRLSVNIVSKFYILTYVPNKELKSACISTQSDQSFHFSHDETASLANQNALNEESDQNANVLADLNLHRVHMSKGMFSDDAAPLVL